MIRGFLSLLICFALIPIIANSTKRYDNYKLYQVVVSNKQQWSALQLLEARDSTLDFWKLTYTTATVMMPSESEETFINYMKLYSIDFKLLNNNFQKVLEVQKKQKRSSKIIKKRYYHSTYLRYDEMITFMEKRKVKCRGIMKCNIVTIGYTYEKRPIKVFQITNTHFEGRPIIWIDAGIHAREWIAPATALYILDQFVFRRTDWYSIFKHYDIFILPLINVDGYEYSHQYNRLWRKNTTPTYTPQCMGVDLNRNFGFMYGVAGTSNDPCSQVYLGTKAFSEPETSSIRDFLKLHQNNIKLFITLHSYGQFIIFPFGYSYNTYPRNVDILRNASYIAANAIEEENKRKYTTGSAPDVLYEAAGGLDDYVAGILNVSYVFTIELRPDENDDNGFLIGPEHIQGAGKDTLIALHKLAEHQLKNANKSKQRG